MATVTFEQALQTAASQIQAGQSAAAEAICRQILAQNPHHADALYWLGVAAIATGRCEAALELIGKAIVQSPNHATYHCDLGATYRLLGRTEAAVACFQRALVLKADLPDAHLNLGEALNSLGRFDEAIPSCRRGLALRPDYPLAHNNLGNALAQTGQREEAIACYERAIALAPTYAEAHNNLGNMLLKDERWDNAIACYGRALALQPDYAEAHSNLGHAFAGKAEFDRALHSYRRAVAFRPDFADGHWHLARLLLLLGQYQEGWREYEWRWGSAANRSRRPRFPTAPWDGAPAPGRTILLHAEQGLGDTIQFLRYASLAAGQCGRVIVECQPELNFFLQGIDGVAQIITHGEPLPAFDLHCPLISLPLAFNTTLETIPAQIPYLRADAHRIDQWRRRLKDAKGLKVGLVWAGNPRLDQPATDFMDRRRSMRLSQFSALVPLSGIVFVSLQKGGPAQQALTPPAGMKLLDWTGELNDLADTAALVEALDLVISVDTSVAHLAGALGKPVWLLNRFDTCWRWLMEREDTPWYPTMRIFRQQSAGDWDSVLQRVAAELSAVRG